MPANHWLTVWLSPLRQASIDILLRFHESLSSCFRDEEEKDKNGAGTNLLEPDGITPNFQPKNGQTIKQDENDDKLQVWYLFTVFFYFY